jgi:RNA polymerase sigma-70 factor, ECF subfamily
MIAPPPIDDDELMLRFAAGDGQAFEVLFARYHGAVYGYAASLLHDAARAEDVLQEVFLIVIREVNRYRPGGTFRAWLLRLCRNQCLNLLAARQRHALVLADPTSAPDACPAESPVAEHHLLVSDDLTWLLARLERLPAAQREALLLVAREGLGYAEAATVMDLPLNSVKTLIHRARGQLAQWRREEGL